MCMTKEEIYTSVLKTVHESMPDIDTGTIHEDTVFTDTGIDSMGFMLIICRLESQYDIKIPDERWQQLLTVNDLIEEIKIRMDEK